MINSIFIVGTILLSSPLVVAAQPVSFNPSPDARANQIFSQTCNFLKAQKFFSFDLDITYDNVLNSGQKVQYSAYQIVKVRKPNSLQVDYKGDQRNTRFYYDGKTFTWLNTDDNLYATQPAPATIDDTVALLETQYGITLPLSNLVVSDPCKIIRGNIEHIEYVGSGFVNRTPAHHLFITGKDRDWQLWVREGEKAIPLKIVITYKDQPSQPQYTAIFSNWNSNPTIPKNSFSFVAPPDAGQINFLQIDHTNDLPKK
ncbi:hypothetical protein DO97_06205 [Neosynechococcus sphagnicola sy1]|uniref:Periplasmic protein n=1 Tax=Neosynechococcus sphagnicola sy1 TaxID=1497020 RepID=A0A098TNM1_9CYAN|nr:hypothetical protein DO97_06205 [Neosynechococcus sphagnicola sy1]